MARFITHFVASRTGPEVDDLDDDPADNTPFPGIDDGLLEPGSKKPEKPEDHDGGR